MNLPLSTYLGLAILIIATFYFGFRDSPLYNPKTFKVEPAYINGILTASGILFGIWALIIGKEPETEPQISQFPYIGELFLVSFILLVFTVVYVALTALNVFSSSFTVLYCMFSFILNALLLALTLRDYKLNK